MEYVKKEVTSYPSYLNAIYGGKNGQIYLCTIKLPSSPTTVVDETIVEYIGNPLEVQTEEHDFVLCKIATKKRTNWQLEEEEQYPMSVDLARQLIHQHNRQEKRDSHLEYPLICICDMKDRCKTLVLGSLQFKNKVQTLKVLYHGLDDSKNETFDKEYMKCIHCNNEFGIKVLNEATCESSYTYDLLPLYTNKLYLQVNIKSDKLEFVDPAYKIIFKVDVIDEALNCFQWSDIKLIQKLINLFENSKEDLSPEHNGLSLKEIKAKLAESISLQLTNQDNSKIRRTILDTWDFAKQAHMVKDLEEFFNLLFFLFASQKDLQFRLEDDDQILLFQLINGSLNGEYELMESITCNLSLYLLIELGLEKLKNYYCNEITKLIRKTYRIDNWRMISNIENLEGKASLLDYVKISPTTLSNILKTNLNKIVHLHVALRMYDLLTAASFDEEALSVNDLIEKYTKMETIRQKPLEEIYAFETSVEYDLSDLCKKREPITYSLKLYTVHKNVNFITTTFYKTTEMILPPCLSSDVVHYDNDNKHLYQVYELREFIQDIPRVFP